mgnify:FL=1
MVKLLPFAVVLALPGGSFAIPLCLRYVLRAGCVRIAACHHVGFRFAPGLLPSTFVKKDDHVTPNIAAIKTHISSSLQRRVRRMVDDLDEKQAREQNLERAFEHLRAAEVEGRPIDWPSVAKTFSDNKVRRPVCVAAMFSMFVTRLARGRGRRYSTW